VVVSGYVTSGVLPLAAQIALTSTVLFSSLSSTILLQVVAHPYVHPLHEILRGGTASTSASAGADADADTGEGEGAGAGEGASTSKDSADPMTRKFRVATFNFLGFLTKTDFTLGEASRTVSNPFASFQVKNKGFYIFGGEIKDTTVRRAVSKEI
jgi:hypothetical protein